MSFIQLTKLIFKRKNQDEQIQDLYSKELIYFRIRGFSNRLIKVWNSFWISWRGWIKFNKMRKVKSSKFGLYFNVLWHIIVQILILHVHLVTSLMKSYYFISGILGTLITETWINVHDGLKWQNMTTRFSIISTWNQNKVLFYASKSNQSLPREE